MADSFPDAQGDIPKETPPLPRLTPEARIEDSLKLEELDTNLFRCLPENLWVPVGSRGVFGGQIVGLCLAAASKTVTENYKAQSLHCYFLLPGDRSRSILFHVEPSRDSNSFATRRVAANQQGKCICLLLCSFMRGETLSVVHQVPPMPKVPFPKDLVSYDEAIASQLHQLPEKFRLVIQARLNGPIPIELRPCRYPSPNDFFLPFRRAPRQYCWFKTRTLLPKDPHLHMCVAAYCSDHQLLWTALQPHAITKFTNPSLTFLVSLDHAMWFHSEFRVDEWMLYEMISPRASGNRGWTLGKVWTLTGELAVTCTQEGLIRIQPSPEKPLTSTVWEMGVDEDMDEVQEDQVERSEKGEKKRNLRRLGSKL